MTFKFDESFGLSGASAVVHYTGVGVTKLIGSGLFICRIVNYCVLRVFYSICNEPWQNLG